MTTTITLAACPSCGSAGAGEVALGTHRLRRCGACGLVHAREYADPDTVYVDGYLTGATDFGPPNVLDPDFQRYLLDVGHRRVALLERRRGRGGAGGAAARQPSLLDVGCGTGDVLAAAAERGWEAVGAEPVAASAAAAVDRGLDVRCALLQETGLPERSFDAVTAYHVVEHMADSTAFVRLLARWARPGGLVAVEVPNWASVQRRLDGERWVGLRPLEHLGHYTPATLRATLVRAGLADVRITSSTYLWHEQTLGEALADVALYGRRRPLPQRLLQRLGRPGDRHGEPVVVPSRAGWAVLRGVAAAYDAVRAGAVITAVGRVPGRA